MKATITKIGNMVFLNFFNSTEVYSIKNPKLTGGIAPLFFAPNKKTA
jgi:hypothetical protein